MLRTLVLLILLLVILPLLPLIFHEPAELSKYFEFPPVKIYVEHSGFSFSVFILLLAAVVLFCSVFVLRLWIFRTTKKEVSFVYSFSRWGLAALAFTLMSWLIAWSRIEVFTSIQHHTFILLWAGFIISANAVCMKLHGRCPLLSNFGGFLWLLPISAVFWWIFEYINRFIQNWTYQEVSHYSSPQYFFLASSSFSMVLPAIKTVKECLEGWSIPEAAFKNFIKINIFSDKLYLIIILISVSSLYSLISIYPNELFWFVWIAAPLMFVALEGLQGRKTFFDDLLQGDWRKVFYWSASGVICGIFWEMWNYYSLSKWVYHVPYVNGYFIFEMPLAGYAGYIPFGVFCGLILELIYDDGEELDPKRRKKRDC